MTELKAMLYRCLPDIERRCDCTPEDVREKRDCGVPVRPPRPEKKR